MYNQHKLIIKRKEEEDKYAKQNPPSFSLSTHDQIYGGNDELSKRQSAKPKSSSLVDDEETASLRRARLIEKYWMKKQKNKKDDEPNTEELRYYDDDDDDDPVTLTDTELGTRPRRSCFAPVRTRVDKKTEKDEAEEHDSRKSSTSSIYKHLKKMKQPISPGGKLNNLLNSLFSKRNSKKTKNSSSSIRGYENEFEQRRTNASPTCSTATSYSRSCLANASLKNEKLTNIQKKSVRFHPVSVIVDENSRPCGHKSVCKGNSAVFGSQMRKYLNAEDNDDYGSDSSSDLFELDHLALGAKSEKYCNELPIYETTRPHRNHVRASGLIT